MSPPRRETRSQKRKRIEQDNEASHKDDGDAGRPVVRLRAGSSKACPITKKQRNSKRNQQNQIIEEDNEDIEDGEDDEACHEDNSDAGRPSVKLRTGSSKARPITNKERNSKQNQQNQPSIQSKYENISLPDLQNMCKPLGIPGTGMMRKDELLQLCILFDSELTAAATASCTAIQPSSSVGVRRKSHTAEPSLSNEKSLQPTTKPPSSKSNNQCTTDTLTQDHQTEIDTDIQLFKTPESQLLQDGTRENQGQMEEDSEASPTDEDQHVALPSRRKGTAVRRNRTTILSDDEGVQDQPAVFPSREKGTALPRPHPTYLSEVAKGKQRRISTSSDDWVPDASDEGTKSPSGSTYMEFEGLEESELADTGIDLGSDDQEDESMENPGSSGEGEEHSFPFDDNIDDGSRAAISRMLAAREQDKRNSSRTAARSGPHAPSRTQDSRTPSGDVGNVEDLRQSVNDLTALVMQLVPHLNSTKNVASKVKKPQGSTFRARIRSHVWTMMGLKSDDDVPASATLGQQSTWKIHTSRKDMMLPCRLDRDVANGLTNSASDPRFPFKGGPGGEHSNPQVLLIMWTMMNRVGVSSFRPIWEESMSTPANKFLWTLATATFLHLVKAGEYDDIRAEDAKFDLIFKALKEHARSSLKRSFRQTNEWSQARLKAHKKNGVRAARLRTLKTRRNTIAIKNKLSPLCELIDNCCSEDETDVDDEANDSPKKIFKVKRFVWRSPRLEALLLRLEAYDAKKRKDSPKSTSGAKPRTRVRDSMDPITSQSTAPSGLPIDCYDPEWLEDVRLNDPNFYEALQVDDTPVLDGLEKQADLTLKI